ncbi:MAG: hypothetical protein JNL25_01710 [Rhodospirillaceae bacterium]|nr:hypothetical protein [Rhodospirillaceae bacterium]
MAFMTSGLKLLVLCAGLAMAGTALANGKLTAENMSKKDYDDITKTESSVPGEEPTSAPSDVHNLDKDKEQKLKDANGVRLIKGKDWKAMTPEERDARLRALKALRPEGSIFLIEVPSGNVWVIDLESYHDLLQDGVLREWSRQEIERLPAVRPNPGDVDYRDRRPGSDRERHQAE